MTDAPTEKPALTKPVFVKVKDLERGRSGFNVYVQVVEANERFVDTRDGQKIRMVDAVIADETGAAKAFFKGESAKDIKKGAVVAIRNGVKKVIKGHISLEIDIFGRVTVEDVKITPDTKLNISDAEIEFEPRKDRPRKPRFGGRRNGGGRNEGNREDRPRRDNGERPPRGDRQPRRDNEERAPRRDREDRGPRRDYENRPPREDREDRPPRRDREDRGPRRDRDEGAPRRDYDNRGPRRDRDEGAPRRDYDNRGPREDRGDRKPRNNDREYDRGNNTRPTGGNRGYQQKEETRYQEKRGDRKPMVKISEIGPGEENIRFIAKVIEATVVPGRNGSNVRCVLGDETGIVNAFIPETEFIKVGNTIALFAAEARVVKEHIEIQRARSEAARSPINKVNESFNLSEKAWVPVD